MTLSNEYYRYIHSEAWNQKRLERLRIDGYVCQDCEADNVALDVHHLTYDNFGNELMGDLISLCRDCHNIRHGKQSWFAGICHTCKRPLLIATKRVKVLGAWWDDFVCSDGHFWSKRL